MLLQITLVVNNKELTEKELWKILPLMIKEIETIFGKVAMGGAGFGCQYWFHIEVQVELTIVLAKKLAERTRGKGSLEIVEFFISNDEELIDYHEIIKS